MTMALTRWSAKLRGVLLLGIWTVAPPIACVVYAP
jgi:hypothetical protein